MKQLGRKLIPFGFWFLTSVDGQAGRNLLRKSRASIIQIQVVGAASAKGKVFYDISG